MKIENSQSHGFTLIELLVVIAIISLLVSILLPSLNRAKELAKRVVCASNLRNVAAAYVLYATEQSGNVPIPVGYASSAKQWNYLIWDPSGRGYIQFGYLYLAGLMSEPKLFYCPEDASFDVWWNPWPPETEDPTKWTRAGYSCRPEALWVSQASPPDPFPSLNDLGQKAIVADLLSSPSDMEVKHKDGVNAGYGDGSALWVDANAFKEPLEAITGWGSEFNPDLDDVWEAFDDQR